MFDAAVWQFFYQVQQTCTFWNTEALNTDNNTRIQQDRQLDTLIHIWLLSIFWCVFSQSTVPLNTSTASVLQFALGEYCITTRTACSDIETSCAFHGPFRPILNIVDLHAMSSARRTQNPLVIIRKQVPFVLQHVSKPTGLHSTSLLLYFSPYTQPLLSK